MRQFIVVQINHQNLVLGEEVNELLAAHAGQPGGLAQG